MPQDQPPDHPTSNIVSPSRLESQWLTGLRAGAESALDAVFDAYYEPMVRFAWRNVRSMDIAEDLVQDVFIQLWERRERLAIRTSLRSYLFGAVYHRLLDYRAHERVVDSHVATVMADAPEGSSMVTPQDELVAAELAARIARRIEALPDRTRTVYQMNRDAGLSYAEIAESLGISVNTVYVLMGRAVKALKETLDDM